MKEVAGELIRRKAASLIKAPVLPKEAKQLSEEEIRSGAAGDKETLEEVQYQKSWRNVKRRCRDCEGETRVRQAIKQEESG